MKHYGIKRVKCNVKNRKYGSNILTVYARSK